MFPFGTHDSSRRFTPTDTGNPDVPLRELERLLAAASSGPIPAVSARVPPSPAVPKREDKIAAASSNSSAGTSPRRADRGTTSMRLGGLDLAYVLSSTISAVNSQAKLLVQVQQQNNHLQAENAAIKEEMAQLGDRLVSLETHAESELGRLSTTLNNVVLELRSTSELAKEGLRALRLDMPNTKQLTEELRQDMAEMMEALRTEWSGHSRRLEAATHGVLVRSLAAKNERLMLRYFFEKIVFIGRRRKLGGLASTLARGTSRGLLHTYWKCWVNSRAQRRALKKQHRAVELLAGGTSRGLLRVFFRRWVDAQRRVSERRLAVTVAADAMGGKSQSYLRKSTFVKWARWVPMRKTLRRRARVAEGLAGTCVGMLTRLYFTKLRRFAAMRCQAKNRDIILHTLAMNSSQMQLRYLYMRWKDRSLNGRRVRERTADALAGRSDVSLTRRYFSKFMGVRERRWIARNVTVSVSAAVRALAHKTELSLQAAACTNDAINRLITKYTTLERAVHELDRKKLSRRDLEELRAVLLQELEGTKVELVEKAAQSEISGGYAAESGQEEQKKPQREREVAVVELEQPKPSPQLRNVSPQRPSAWQRLSTATAGEGDTVAALGAAGLSAGCVHATTSPTGALGITAPTRREVVTPRMSVPAAARVATPSPSKIGSHNSTPPTNTPPPPRPYPRHL